MTTYQCQIIPQIKINIFQNYLWFNSTARELLSVHLDSLIEGRCV